MLGYGIDASNAAVRQRGGGGGPPPAPVLTWTSGTSVYNPIFNLTGITANDVVELQIDDAASFASLFGSDTNNINAAEAASGSVTFPGIAALTPGTTFFARARLRRSGTWSAWSNTVSKAMDAPSLSAVTTDGVTFTFAAARPAGQYANGDWWVQGPVSITAISPAGTTVSGTDGNGAAYSGRVVHGTMVNPGNRSFATGGLLANNTNNTVQGWDSILAGGKPVVAYSAAANVDPGKTGTALDVTTGSVVKFVSRLTGLGTDNRPAGTDMTVLTVVDAAPASGAVRPGVSRTSKTSLVNSSQFDLGVLQNLAPTASAPTYAEALDWIDAYFETSQPDSINNPTAKGSNNHPEYGRDIGNNLHRAMLCLHLSSFTAAEKRTLLCHLAAIADDLVSRAEEGSITSYVGGGNQWKKPVIALCAATLGANAPASWLTYLSYANRMAWSEEGQLFRVTGYDIALPRYTADGRPRSAYTQAMVGSVDWGEQPTQPAYSGSNWNAFYRDTVGYSLYPGALAVELTTGAKALWDSPDFWLYMDTMFNHRTEGGAGNTMLAFPLEMANAYRPAKVAAPALVETGIKDAALWLRFDLSLNETASLPATTDFTVNVNGAPVTVSSVSVWRQNVGLVLASAVTGNDVVTLNYTAGANPVRSVDNVNAANLVAQAITNRTDKVGGPNAAYPVVSFGSGVVRTLGGTGRLGAANGHLGTVALLKFRFPALPAATSRIFGYPSGIPGLQLFLFANGSLELRLVNSAGTTISRSYTANLSANTDYDILWSFDHSQATLAAGINCYKNGVADPLTSSTYTSGGTIGWNNGATYRWNNDGFAFQFGAFWLDPTSRVDLTNAANRAKFTSLTSGNLDILTRGDGITGSIPQHFHVGNADQWNDGAGMNRGTGNKFFVTSGAVSLVSGGAWI